MRRKLIAANWKMYKTPDQARAFVSEFKPMIAGHDRDDTALFPPFISIPATLEAVAGTKIEVGAQLRNVARDLAADLNGGHRLQGAGRSDRVDDIASRDRRRVHRRLRPALAHVIRAGAGADDPDDEQTDNQTFHNAFALTFTSYR